jgi:hypothetical protein
MLMFFHQAVDWDVLFAAFHQINIVEISGNQPLFTGCLYDLR